MEQGKKSEKEEDEEQQRLWSWGAGTEGQLGTSRFQDEHLPQLLHQPSLSSISSLACGGAHVIAFTNGIFLSSLLTLCSPLCYINSLKYLFAPQFGIGPNQSGG